jgi:hypothetical protein
MRFVLAVASMFAVTLAASIARADDAPPVPAAQTDDDGWSFRYKQARDRLISGDFGAAARMFDELAGETRDPLKRALATEQAALAREWQGRGLVLVKQSILGESNVSAKSVNERTTDELAVLYTSAVLWGIGSGAWTSVLTKPDSAAGVVLPIFAFAGAGTGLVAAIDLTGRPFRYGVPQSIVSGLYIGLEEGIVLSLWNTAGQSADQWKAGTTATVIWGTSTAGAVLGGVIGSAVGTTPGRASFVGSSALWGGVLVGMLAGAATPDNSSGQGALLAAGIGLNAGAIGGILAAGPVSPSIARVRFLDLGGIVGGLVAGGLYLAASNKNPDGHVALGVTALGVGAGLGVAWYATSGMHEDRLEEHQDKPKAPEAKWSPTIAPTKDGMMLGMQGMF